MPRKKEIDAGLDLLSTAAVTILEQAHEVAVSRQKTERGQRHGVAELKAAAVDVGVIADAMAVLLKHRAAIG